MPKRKTVFYAYPSEPPAIGETINAAIDKLKENPEIVENNVRFKPWPELDVSGKP